MPKIKVKLRELALRGETTSTKWGLVSFDRDGFAELEVDEDQLPLLAGLKWLVEEPTQPQEEAEVVPPPTETGEPAKDPEIEDLMGGPKGAEPTETEFDTSDSEPVPEPTPEALEAMYEAEAEEAEAAEAAEVDPNPMTGRGVVKPHGGKKSGKRR